MIEMRWHRLGAGDPSFGGGLVFTFADEASVVLQFRYRLPRHPGFVMQANPATGAPVEESDRWSEWIVVGEEEGPADLGGEAA